MPTIGEFAFGPDAKYIRVDPCPEDIGRNLPIDIGLVSCEKAALEALFNEIPAMKHDAWVAEIADARKKFEDECDAYYKVGAAYTDAVHCQVCARWSDPGSCRRLGSLREMSPLFATSLVHSSNPWL